MTRLPAAVLLHTTACGAHYDLLLADPTDAGGRLWAARVMQPPDRWARLGGLTLTPLPPHRPRYLAYTGPLTGGRGHIRRVDAGRHTPRRWARGLILTTLRLRNVRRELDLRLDRLGPACWRAVVLADRAVR